MKRRTAMALVGASLVYCAMAVMSSASAAPFVDILTTNMTVPYFEWSVTLDGTNNDAVVGTMTWTNLLSGASDSMPATSPWSVYYVFLDVGANDIIVAGTDVFGVVAADTVTVTRLPAPPTVIDITNETQILPPGTTNTMIGGCYSNIMQTMFWWNDRDGEQFFVPIQQPFGWFVIAVHNLQPGTNNIIVQGWSSTEQPVEDTTTVIVTLPQPFVDILSTNAIVSFDDWLLSIHGTNNAEVVGDLTWTNLLFGGSGTLPAVSPWQIDNILLDVGTNDIIVVGTNTEGVIAADTVSVTRLPEPMPFVDITNATQVLPFGTTNALIGGCYSNMAQLAWWNDRDGASQPLDIPGPDGWFIAAITNLQVGTNVITVWGFSPRERPAEDTTTIIVEWPKPFVDILTTNSTVPFTVPAIDVVGTNNTAVVGTMTWTNVLNGVAGDLAATTPWQIADLPLDVGPNTLIVAGTNLIGDTAADTVTVTRLPEPPPFVDITNPVPQVVAVPWVTVGGTNAVGTTLVCCSNERTGFVQAPFAWGDVMPNLVEGIQTLAVYGTNGAGLWTADWHQVTYVIAQPDIQIIGPAGLIENGGSYDFGAVLTGTTRTAQFWIQSIGTAPLTCQPVTVTGPEFAVVLQPQTEIAAGMSSRYDIAVTPVGASALSDTSVISNNVPAKSPYLIHVTATPVVPSGGQRARVWYHLARLKTGMRCRFQYNTIGPFTPCFDGVALQVNGNDCLGDVAVKDPYHWHYRYASTSYRFYDSVPSSGRVAITLDTRRQRGMIYVKKLLMPLTPESYLPIALQLGTLDSLELPYFAGADRGLREHFNSMGYRSNIFIVTGTRVRYHKRTPATDDTLVLRGMCMTNAACVLPQTFTATFTWGVCGTGRTNVFTLDMQRGVYNVCRSTTAGPVTARIAFTRGRWRLRATGLNLDQAAAGPIPLHAALQLGDSPVVFSEAVEYMGTVLTNANRNIVY